MARVLPLAAPVAAIAVRAARAVAIVQTAAPVAVRRVVLATAVVVRAISLGVDGGYPGYLVPMIVETVHVALLVAAWKVLPHHRIEELTS